MARLKQGDLLDALTKHNWSQRDAARFLGVHPVTFGHWINMTEVPKTFTAEMTIKLHEELTGKMPEELFPEFIQSEEFRAVKKVRRVTFETDPSHMIGRKEMLLIEAPTEMTPDGILRGKELERDINKVLHTLPPKYEEVIRRVVMGGEREAEVAKSLGVSTSEINRRKLKALRLLRHPSCSRKLVGHLQ